MFATADGERRSPFWRRDFFKSGPAPALVAPCKGSETESIMRQANSATHFAARQSCFSCSQIIRRRNFRQKAAPKRMRLAKPDGPTRIGGFILYFLPC